MDIHHSNSLVQNLHIFPALFSRIRQQFLDEVLCIDGLKRQTCALLDLLAFMAFRERRHIYTCLCLNVGLLNTCLLSLMLLVANFANTK